MQVSRFTNVGASWEARFRERVDNGPNAKRPVSMEGHS